MRCRGLANFRCCCPVEPLIMPRAFAAGPRANPMTAASTHRQYLPVALIVDSDPDTTEMYAAALSLEGFTTVEAQAADQVWHWVQVAPPTIVITELKLEGALDGVGFIRQLRESEGTRGVPIVVVSNRTAPPSV